MKTFEVSENLTVSQFLDRVKNAISGRSLGDIVTIKETDGKILVTIQKLGTSELQFQVQKKDAGGFLATLSGEKIAFTHKPLRKDVEGKLQKLLESLGAKTTA